jgi:protein-S-isoprenylcysteine O-methyltransferase Ste14
MSLRNALGLFFLGLMVAASAPLWFVEPRGHVAPRGYVVLAATQLLIGIVMAVWGAWKGPRSWKPRAASRKSRANVAA